MLAIALSSFREALKKKIVLIIAILTFIYIVVLTAITYYGMTYLKKSGAGMSAGEFLSSASMLVSVLGFYFSSMIAALLTIMASVGAISADIESGVIYSVISKPIKRSDYVMGKFLGLSVLSAAYSAFLFIYIVILNYAIGVPPLDKPNATVLLEGLAIFVLEPLVILSVSIWGGTTFKTINNGIFMVALYILGIMGGMMEQIGSITGLEGLEQSGVIISLISPFDTIYRKMTDIIYSSSNMQLTFSSPLFLSGKAPSDWMILYVCLFAVLMLSLAVRKFNRKDMP